MACDNDPELIEPMDPIIPVACFTYDKDGYTYTFDAECSENAADYEWDFNLYSNSQEPLLSRSFEKNPTHTYKRSPFGYNPLVVRLRVFSKSGDFHEMDVLVTPGEAQSNQICTECGCRENTFASVDWVSFCGTEEEVVEFEKDYRRGYCYNGIYEGCRRQ